MRNILAKVVEKIKTHILCSVTFSRKSCRLGDNVEICGGASGATNDGHTSCVLDQQDYMHARACARPRARAHAR